MYNCGTSLCSGPNCYDCTSIGLVTIDCSFPSTLQGLYLSYNYISYVSPYAFASWPALEYMYVSRVPLFVTVTMPNNTWFPL